MNIFCTSEDPVQSALWLDDKRVNKMILETTQLMSTAVRMCSKEELPPNIYKITHSQHPVSIWARVSIENFDWLFQHAKALATILKKNGTVHSSIITICLVNEYRDCLPKRPRTPFCNCARNLLLGLDYTHMPVQEAYRAYLNARWQMDVRNPTWKNRQEPQWRI